MFAVLTLTRDRNSLRYSPGASGARIPWRIFSNNVDKPQQYFYSPLWDGGMEGGNYTYLVPRGFVHVLPDPRGMGNSEGCVNEDLAVRPATFTTQLNGLRRSRGLTAR